MEAAEAGIEFIVCITEGVPAHDEAWFYNKLRRDFPAVQLLGPTRMISGERVMDTPAVVSNTH